MNLLPLVFCLFFFVLLLLVFFLCVFFLGGGLWDYDWVMLRTAVSAVFIFNWQVSMPKLQTRSTTRKIHRQPHESMNILLN